MTTDHPDPDARSREIAAESLADDQPTAWFERLYAAAAEGTATVPWDREAPSALLVEWAEAAALDGAGRRALVVGCGFGRDAEYVASLGFDTVGFDISETAIRTARQRHEGSGVAYFTADLFDLPVRWRGEFDLVVESMTIQSLPPAVRRPAIINVSRLLARGGTLLVIAVARASDDPAQPGPPWPLTRDEIDAFVTGTSQAVRVEDIPDADDPDVHRWRAEIHRPISDGS